MAGILRFRFPQIGGIGTELRTVRFCPIQLVIRLFEL